MLVAGKNENAPAPSIRPIEPGLVELVNQTPPGPAAIPVGERTPSFTRVDTAPVGVIFPMEFPLAFVNHRFPSGPASIPLGAAMPGPVKLPTAPTGAPASAGTPSKTEQQVAKSAAQMIATRLPAPRP